MAPNGNSKHKLPTAMLKIYDDCGEWRGQELPLLPLSPPVSTPPRRYTRHCHLESAQRLDAYLDARSPSTWMSPARDRDEWHKRLDSYTRQWNQGVLVYVETCIIVHFTALLLYNTWKCETQLEHFVFNVLYQLSYHISSAKILVSFNVNVWRQHTSYTTLRCYQNKSLQFNLYIINSPFIILIS